MKYLRNGDISFCMSLVITENFLFVFFSKESNKLKIHAYQFNKLNLVFVQHESEREDKRKIRLAKFSSNIAPL